MSAGRLTARRRSANFGRGVARCPSALHPHRAARSGRLLPIPLQGHDALAAYARAEKARPGFHGAINEHGVALHALRRHVEALAVLDELIRVGVTGGASRVHLCRVRTLIALGRLDEAEIDLRRAIEIRRGYTEAESELNELLRRIDC